MNRWRAAWLLALLTLIQPAQSQGAYVNREVGFRFNPPAGWKQKRPTDGGPGFVAAFVEAEELGGGAAARSESDADFLKRIQGKLRNPPRTGRILQASLSIIALHVPQSTLEQYARETRAREEKLSGSAYHVVMERTRALGGVPAMERTARISAAGNPVFVTREVACMRNGKLFAISITAPYARFRPYSIKFRRVIESFEWLR